MNNTVVVDKKKLDELLGAVKYFEETAPFTAPFDKGKWLMMEQNLHYAREGIKADIGAPCHSPEDVRALIEACKHITVLRPGPVDPEYMRYATEKFSIGHATIDLLDNALAPF